MLAPFTIDVRFRRIRPLCVTNCWSALAVLFDINLFRLLGGEGGRGGHGGHGDLCSRSRSRGRSHSYSHSRNHNRSHLTIKPAETFAFIARFSEDPKG